MKKWAAILIVTLAAFAHSAQGRASEGLDEPNIEQLIRQLNDPSYEVRQAATRKLVEIGPLALPEIRQAMRSDDPEVRIRAQEIYEEVLALAAGLGPEQFKEIQLLRKAAQQALRKASHKRIIKLCKELTASPAATVADWMLLAHGWQLAGDWAKAVAIYQDMVRWIRGRENLPQADPSWPANRAAAILRIGRIQREELKDVQAAAATFAEAAEQFKGGDASSAAEPFRIACLRELAACQEQMGRPAEALKTWAAVHACCEARSRQPTYGFDVGAVIRLLAKLPADKPLPGVPGVIVLTPAAPKAVVPVGALGQPAPARRAPGPDRWHRLVLAPPPGREFQTVRIECDFSADGASTPRHLYCSTRPFGQESPNIHLGGIDSTGDAVRGRKASGKQFHLPAGAGAVHVDTSAPKDGCGYDLVLAATFRPHEQDAPKLTGKMRFRVDVLPRGGRFTRNGEPAPASPRVIQTRIRPGRHVFEYALAEPAETFRAELHMEAGRSYGLFVNMDCPFRPTFMNLYRGDESWHGWASSLVQLPDGRLLLAYCGPDRKIMLSASKDGRTWADPWPLPFNSVFSNVAPALFADAAGTVHLAWFSSRLRLPKSPGGCWQTLWLTSSRDGRSWAPPRGLAAVDYGTNVPPVRMLRGPKGKYWIFWRLLAASGQSIGEVGEFRRVKLPPEPATPTQLDTPSVAVDADGTFHMAYTRSHRNLYHATSADGLKWSSPRLLMEVGSPIRATNPQLILAGGKAAVIYEQGAGSYIGAFLTPIRLAGPAVPSAASMKISPDFLPLLGSQCYVSNDGEALLLVGDSDPWLLRAKLKELPAPPAER